VGSSVVSHSTIDRLELVYDEAGRPLQLVFNGRIYNYVLNLQGDVQQIRRATDGVVVATYLYNAWGQLLQSSGVMAESNPIRYRGYFWCSAAEMYYLQSRFYDPVIGRFINADATWVLGVEQGSLLQYNLFAYCHNNPVNFYDPDGYILKKILAGAAKGAIKSVAVQVTINVITGQNITKGVVDAAVGGAVAGAVNTTLKLTGVSPHLAGAFAGATSEYVVQLINGTPDPARVMRSAMLGGVTGALTPATRGPGVQNLLEPVGDFLLGAAEKLALDLWGIIRGPAQGKSSPNLNNAAQRTALPGSSTTPSAVQHHTWVLTTFLQ